MSFSLAHHLRIEIRAALHEGPATRAKLAKMVGEPPEALTFHLKEMLRDGSIDIYKTEKVGNMDRHYYCVVELPRFSDEQMAAFGQEERQTICAIAVQAASAEALASLRAGKMAVDPRVVLAWNRIQLDQQGRDELADEEVQTWSRRYGIAAEAASRLAESGEPGITHIITSFAYERSRKAAPEPLSVFEPPKKASSRERLAAIRKWRQAEDHLVEDAVSYSLGHRIRIEIRAALHEGPTTASRLAEILQEPVNLIDYHLKEMLGNGSIDLAKTVKVGNVDQHYYSVVSLPYFSEEEYAAMGRVDRQTLCAIAVQAAIAEAMASLWAGKMAADPRTFLAWDRIVLDREGRKDLTVEEEASWQRKQELEVRSANRRAKSGEPGTTYIITSFSYERSRSSAPDALKESHLATKASGRTAKQP
ncbi:MAG TPA: winged helix-turn-helix domain-containing protein [Solirubrobacterales bacterium]